MNNKQSRFSFYHFALIISGILLAKMLDTSIQASGINILPATVVQTNKANTYTTGTQDFSAVPIKQPTYQIGVDLPSAASASGATVQVTNGATANDCTVGGGSSIVWCRSNGVAWSAVGGASAGSGTVNSATKGQLTYYAAAGTAVSGASVTGIVKGNDGIGAPSAAVAADVVGLFSGCSGVLPLTADGSCHTASSTTLSGFYADTDGTNFFGPIFSLVKPSAVTFAWRNQGGASETAVGNGALYLLAPNAAGNNMRIREINAPATPYSIEQTYLMQYFNVNFNSCGPVFVDTTTGKLVSFIATDSASQGMSIQVNYMTNVTTFSSTPVSAAFILGGNGPITLMVTDDGTNLIFKWGTNRTSSTYYTFATLGRHAFLAAGPDKVGWHCDSNNATYPASSTLIGWQQS